MNIEEFNIAHQLNEEKFNALKVLANHFYPGMSYMLFVHEGVDVDIKVRSMATEDKRREVKIRVANRNDYPVMKTEVRFTYDDFENMTYRELVNVIEKMADIKKGE